jgi:hypothetical protein
MMNDESSTASTAPPAGASLTLDGLTALIREFDERHPEPGSFGPFEARLLLAACGHSPTPPHVGPIYARTAAGDVCVYPGDPHLADEVLPVPGRLAAGPPERLWVGRVSPLPRR